MQDSRVSLPLLIISCLSGHISTFIRPLLSDVREPLFNDLDCSPKYSVEGEANYETMNLRDNGTCTEKQ